jgi:hypothetical protein
MHRATCSPRLLALVLALSLSACAYGEEPGLDGSLHPDASGLDVPRDTPPPDSPITIDTDASRDARSDVPADHPPPPDAPTCAAPTTLCGTECVDTQTSPDHCGRCGNACASGLTCTGGDCIVTCTTGQTACTVAGTMTCVDTRTNPNHCGRCGMACSAGQMCMNGTCITPVTLPNDRCATPTAITMSRGAQDLSVNTTTATTEAGITAPCGAGFGADVFYTFTLTRREMVYVDTYGSEFDTVVFLASSCTEPLTVSGVGEAACNDDASCSTARGASSLVATLDAGTYYLVLGGAGGARGSARLRFEHLPVGNGPIAVLPRGNSRITGTTSGTGSYPLVCGSATGAGAEAMLWWTTCPDARSGAFYADTCATSWDTILFLTHGATGSGDCNDDDPAWFFSCSPQSVLDSTVPAGAGLHMLVIDGYRARDVGPFTIDITRP